MILEEVLMKKCIKTTISRAKLYERNYTRDSIEKVEYDKEVEVRVQYNSLIKVLTSMYLDSHKEKIEI